MQRRYTVVDVFSIQPLLGNPVAVILDADGLDTATMQHIARWTNLSETTFVLPPTDPGADYRLRIFTPVSELPFAGHPTLGSAHAVLGAGIVAVRRGGFVQQCGVGLVPVEVASIDGGSGYRLRLPPAKFTAVAATAVVALQDALGAPLDAAVAPAVVDVGPRWLVARLESAPALLALRPDMVRLAAVEQLVGAIGTTLFAPRDDGGAHDIEVRSFAPSDGVPEDPVCGSGNGSVAAFRRERGLLPAGQVPYLARQGCCLGRDGRVHVTVEPSGEVWVGGACVTTVDGTLHA